MIEPRISWAHSTVGSFICKYCRRKEWSKCRQSSNKACHHAAKGICCVGSIEVDGYTVRFLAQSFALKTVFSSLTHFKKFEPSEFKGANIKDCILPSMKVGCVDIASMTNGLLAIDLQI